MTKVTKKKLTSTRQKWNCKSIEYIVIEVRKDEYEARLYELAQILYSELCQRPKSQDHELGIIQEHLELCS